MLWAIMAIQSTCQLPSYQRQGNDNELKSLVEDIKGGSVDVIIFNGANPVYDSAYGKML
jgi:hypothetical protein